MPKRRYAAIARTSTMQRTSSSRSSRAPPSSSPSISTESGQLDDRRPWSAVILNPGILLRLADGTSVPFEAYKREHPEKCLRHESRHSSRASERPSSRAGNSESGCLPLYRERSR